MTDNSADSAGGGSQERRRSPRETLLVHAVTARVHMDSKELIQGSVQDLSAEGARIKGDPKGLKTGDVVQITFIFPLNHKIEYRSVIRHVSPGDSFGIEFVM